MLEITLKKQSRLILQRSEQFQDTVEFKKGVPVYLHEDDAVAQKIMGMEQSARYETFEINEGIREVSISPDWERHSSNDLNQYLIAVGKYKEGLSNADITKIIRDSIEEGTIVVRTLTENETAATSGDVNKILKEMKEMRDNHAAQEKVLADALEENENLKKNNQNLEARLGKLEAILEGLETDAAADGKGTGKNKATK